jgi:hypothetical protein
VLYSRAVCIFPTLNLSPAFGRCFFSDYFFLSPVPSRRKILFLKHNRQPRQSQ